VTELFRGSRAIWRELAPVEHRTWADVRETAGSRRLRLCVTGKWPTTGIIDSLDSENKAPKEFCPRYWERYKQKSGTQNLSDVYRISQTYREKIFKNLRSGKKLKSLRDSQYFL
jgi:hypothetical protein